MKYLEVILIILLGLSVKAQKIDPEDCYITAFNEISDMLANREPLSIKKSAFLAEWAFYEDYQFK